MQKLSNSLITFDAQLKTVLSTTETNIQEPTSTILGLCNGIFTDQPLLDEFLNKIWFARVTILNAHERLVISKKVWFRGTEIHLKITWSVKLKRHSAPIHY